MKKKKIVIGKEVVGVEIVDSIYFKLTPDLKDKIEKAPKRFAYPEYIEPGDWRLFTKEYIPRE